MEELENSGIDPSKTPLCKKAFEIFEVVKEIGDLIPENSDMLQSVKQFMMEDAGLIYVKSASGTKSELYDMKMEAAVIVRKAANSLYVQIHALRMHGFEHYEYFNIVRDLIEELRELFIDWVDKFDPWNYIIDRWGLFNPPGVGPNDKDPDEDIPFDPNDFFDM